MDKESTIKIRVVNLYKSFGESQVLRGVDLEVHQGESMVVIGGSGSGKDSPHQMHHWPRSTGRRRDLCGWFGGLQFE